MSFFPSLALSLGNYLFISNVIGRSLAVLGAVGAPRCRSFGLFVHPIAPRVDQEGTQLKRSFLLLSEATLLALPEYRMFSEAWAKRRWLVTVADFDATDLIFCCARKDV